jgi:alpha-tubulin suppressor-like RCC1 family protein
LLTDQSLLYGFGDNSYNQLGIPSETLKVFQPTLIKVFGSPFIQIAGGNNHSLCLTSRGLIL